MNLRKRYVGIQGPGSASILGARYDRGVKLCELNGVCWPNAYYPDLTIDRSGLSVREYLTSLGIEWTRDPKGCDVLVRKAELTEYTLQSIDAEQRFQAGLNGQSWIYLIGEPRELAPLAYMFAPPAASLAVAPGHEFKRMQFCAEWKDPELEGWKSRADRICWIGRPIHDRIKAANEMIARGLPLDIFSREPWPVSAWRGPAEDDVLTAKTYRYRIVFENSVDHLYHSEKAFTSMRSGCVTFYRGDPRLDLKFLKGAVIPYSLEALLNREALAAKALDGMNAFLFSNDWEIYSPREFYRRIHDLAQQVVGRAGGARKVSR